jgi:hypothetical protein
LTRWRPQCGIRQALPEDGILIEDLTQVGYVSRLAFPVHGPRQYLTSGYQGTLGLSYPTALGAKIAWREKVERKGVREKKGVIREKRCQEPFYRSRRSGWPPCAAGAAVRTRPDRRP